MNIRQIDIYKLNIPMLYPVRIPLGVIDAVRNVVIKITTTCGLEGWGEGSAFAPITGDSQASNYAAAPDMARLILGQDALAIEARMRSINGSTIGEPSLRSAFDMALYDLAARAANMPLYQFLGGESGQPLRTDLTIGLQNSVEETIACAKDILEQGFDAIKMKVGRQGLADVEHVAAVRSLAGPDIAIKIDSNQGWDYPTAVANIQAMKDLNLQYSEQPLAHWNFEGLARLRQQVDLPVCADESVFDDKDALKLVNMGAADYLNIKLGKSGGLHTALKINAIAESGGHKCMIGCFGESRLALSAAAHLAKARPNIAFLDLDSAFQFARDPVIGGLKYDEKRGGVIHLGDDIGLGARFDESMLDQDSRIVVKAS